MTAVRSDQLAWGQRPPRVGRRKSRRYCSTPAGSRINRQTRKRRCGWCGRRLGAFLVTHSLRALKAEGAEEMWLCVNVNNPAQDLYRRLGFTTFPRGPGTPGRDSRPRHQR
ncbi:MAG TPA: GNAT family N-acetyltransferase [Microlunatus sp.]